MAASVIAVALTSWTSAAAAQEPEDTVPAPVPAPPPAPVVTEAPFGWGDFTWMNGQSRQKDFPLKAFGDAVTLSLYLDVNYAYSLNHPRDDTFTGTASVPRHNEFNVNLASVGMEWNYKNVIGRLSLQYGSTEDKTALGLSSRCVNPRTLGRHNGRLGFLNGSFYSGGYSGLHSLIVFEAGAKDQQGTDGSH